MTAEEDDPKTSSTSATGADATIGKKGAGASGGGINDVTVHPLVLLSAADHYHRVARGTRKRVVGVLLGQIIRGNADVTNSFAVPFEEDSKNPVRNNTEKQSHHTSQERAIVSCGDFLSACCLVGSSSESSR